ncbi:hypothetical protein GCM10017557_72750 [Streptomyces aurantiacus]|uniref:Uncharacterized protein n=1 Tax=Streptomyces aurantiacus TaxID=47760 RepID=A0A7G1PFA6_9ACTN|nr:hypothetical protein GCM10017557_72750 [Streptomyces aurantiacus]
MPGTPRARTERRSFPTEIHQKGPSTDLVRQQVIRSFRGRRNLVLSALSGKEPPQSERNAQRRAGH